MDIIQYPDSPFKLHRPFAPAGDQPTAIAGLLEGLSDGLAYQTLLGVTGSGKTYTMANVIAQSGRPAIIMAHNKTLAAQLYAGKAPAWLEPVAMPAGSSLAVWRVKPAS